MLKITLISLLFGGLFAESWQLQSVFKAYDSLPAMAMDSWYRFAPDGNIWVAIQGGMAGDSLAHTLTPGWNRFSRFCPYHSIHVFTQKVSTLLYSPIRPVGSSDAGNLDTLHKMV